MTGFVQGRKKPASAASSSAHSKRRGRDVRGQDDRRRRAGGHLGRTGEDGRVDGGPMRQTKTAGVGSTLPTPSTARTRSSCTPGSRSGNSVNSPQPENATPSSEHSKSRPGSFAGEGEEGDRVVGARRRAGVDARVRRDVDRPLVQRGRLVRDADRQHRGDLERVLARREVGVGHWRQARRGRRQVERALEGRGAVRGEEREPSRSSTSSGRPEP